MTSYDRGWQSASCKFVAQQEKNGVVSICRRLIRYKLAFYRKTILQLFPGIYDRGLQINSSLRNIIDYPALESYIFLFVEQVLVSINNVCFDTAVCVPF